MRVTVGKRVLWDPERIKPWDWLLIVGLTLAPMTGLRIWKIGPGEVLCLLWGLKSLFSRRVMESDIARFFALFIIGLCAGSIVGSFVAPNELRLSDLFTWIYLGIVAVSVYEGLERNDLPYNEQLLNVFSVTGVLWYLFLFVYSRTVSRSFLGAPLWYSSARFSGGGTNPHQIAVLLCALTFVFLRSILYKKRVLISALGILACLFLIIQTDSSTGLLAVVIGFLVSAYFMVGVCSPRYKNAVFIIMTLVIILVVVIGYSTMLNRFLAWIAKDANGLGRLRIFSTFSISFSKSPIIGLGPGIHGMDGLIEFHNTYIEILAATGLTGGVIFLVYSIKLFRKTLISDWRLFPIIISMYAYGLAGFAMRRLVYWGIVAFVSILSKQIYEKQHTNRIS